MALTPLERKLLTALRAALEHLEYCGYGDAWERECATGLDARINSAIAAAERKRKKT